MDPKFGVDDVSVHSTLTHFQNLTQPKHFIIMSCIYCILHLLYYTLEYLGIRLWTRLDLDLVVGMKYLDIDPVIEMSKKMGSFLDFLGQAGPFV